MGKDKDNEVVDEASEESFPASDAPSWTALPRAPTRSGQQGMPPAATGPRRSDGFRRLARQASQLGPDFFLWTGLGVAAVSLGLLMSGKRRAGMTVGIWVPSILLCGVYNQLAREKRPAIPGPSIH